MSLISIVSFLFTIFCSCADGAYDGSGEFVFQKYLSWNYTYMNPECTSPSGRNPCQDIRICNFAAASLAIGGWPTLCGWVGKGVPKVCCGLPLILGPTLMKRVDEEIARKRACGTNIHANNLSETENQFMKILQSLPKIDISEPEKFDPPLDLTKETMVSSLIPSNTRQGQFPWMVSIHDGESHMCGGSLIDRRHILTAAHCVENDLKQYTVHVGNLYADEGYPINVTKIRIHQGYRRQQRYKDVALLTLEQEILTPRIPHLCLPDKGTDGKILGANSTLLLWGRTTAKDKESKPWLCVTDGWDILPTDECRKNNVDVVPTEELESYICAERMEQRLEGCERAAGGLLMFKNKLDNPYSYDSQIPWTLIGLDNLEPIKGPNRENSKHTLFTRLSSYMDWIKETIDEDSSSSVNGVKLK